MRITTFPSLLGSLLLFQTVSQMDSIKYKSHSSKKLPKIWLQRYSLADSQLDYEERSQSLEKFRTENLFKNEYISKNLSDFVVSDQIIMVVFSCESTYPVAWHFPFPEQISHIHEQDMTTEHKRDSDFNSEMDNPINTRYKTSIHFYFYGAPFFSVNLTCKSVKKDKYQASIHIFYDGFYKLENDQETLQIKVPPVNDDDFSHKSVSPLILPCRPAAPDIILTLDKERVLDTENGTNQWTPLNVPKSYLTFDPKVGFSIRRKVLRDVSGLYRCSVSTEDSLDPDQFVLFNVTEGPSDEEVKAEYTDKSVVNGTARVQVIGSLSDTQTSDISCCSGVQNDAPTLLVRHCQNPMQCGILKTRIIKEFEEFKERHEHYETYEENATRRTDCSRGGLFLLSVFVMCQGKNVDYKEQFVNLFNPGVNGPIATRRQRVWDALMKAAQTGLNATIPPESHLPISLYESTSLADIPLPNQKMVILTAAPIEEIDVSEDFQSSIGIYIDNFDDWRAYNEQLFQEYPRDEYYEGEVLIFVCLGLKYFHAEGPRLRLNWENGTKSVLSGYQEPKGTLLRRVYFSGKVRPMDTSGDDMTYGFGQMILAEPGMKSVDCWMPQQHSSGWDKLTKETKIKPSVAPRFEEPMEETLYLSLGESEKITCTIVEGLPPPMISMTIDGKPIWEHNYRETEEYEVEGTDTSVVVSIAEVKHEHHGIYKCTATNVNATVTRRIQVFISKKHSVALPVSLAITGVLMLIAVGLWMKYWCFKTKMLLFRSA